MMLLKKVALGTLLVFSLALILWAYFVNWEPHFQFKKETGSTAHKTESIVLTEENFQSQVLESTKPVLVDFWAEWCGPCHAMAPIIEELAVDFEGRAKVAKLDVEENENIATQYGILGIPALLFFKDGQVMDEIIGIASKQAITETLRVLVEENTILPS